MSQITGFPIKGDAAERGEPNTVRASERWFSDLQVIGRLTMDKYPPLQPVRPTQIALARYGLGDASKVGFVSGPSMPKEVGDDMQYSTARFHAIRCVCCE